MQRFPLRVHARNAREIALDRDGQRRPIARDYLFRARGLFQRSFQIESDGARFVLSTRDKEISRILFVHGHYDRPLLQRVMDILSGLGRADPREGLFLDVGANIGSATVEALVHFGFAGAVALEPDPDNFSFLQRNVVANGLTDRVAARRVAVSDRVGELRFERSEVNWGDHRVRLAEPRVNELGERARACITVPATTLDALADSGDLDVARVGLAWIDVQGHEPNVLAGATALVESGVPVVMEYWPYGLRSAGALERLDALLAERYTHFVDASERAERHAGGQVMPRPTAELSRLHAAYAGPHDPADLVLLRL